MKLFCTVCGEPCGKSYKGILVHDNDHLKINGPSIDVQFADHDPQVDVIETRGVEHG